MDTSISKKHMERIRRKVESGQYGSPDDVLEKALTLLDEHDDELGQELAEIKAKVNEGIDQLRQGDYVECTDENLDNLLQEIESEAIADLQPHPPRAE